MVAGVRPRSCASSGKNVNTTPCAVSPPTETIHPKVDALERVPRDVAAVVGRGDDRNERRGGLAGPKPLVERDHLGYGGRGDHQYGAAMSGERRRLSPNAHRLPLSLLDPTTHAEFVARGRVVQ